jgi:hypothetical protein
MKTDKNLLIDGPSLIPDFFAFSVLSKENRAVILVVCGFTQSQTPSYCPILFWLISLSESVSSVKSVANYLVQAPRLASFIGRFLSLLESYSSSPETLPQSTTPTSR